MGFGFDRLGVRVPAMLISAYTPQGAVINDEMHHGSVIATLAETLRAGPAERARRRCPHAGERGSR